MPSEPAAAPSAEPSAAPDTAPAAAAPETAAPIAATVAALRASFAAGTTRGVDARLAQLDALLHGLRAEEKSLTRALAEDLGKSRLESAITELGVLTQEIVHMRKHLRGWLKPEKLRMDALLAPASGEIWREPLGTVLVIAPWNYPLNLSLGPVIGAIAGGNTVVLKPSELAPATSAALARLVAEHLDPAWVRVVEGGVEETTALLAEPVDLVFYTGNGRVGRIVARAGAEHLTPVVLELGGKSPVVVADDADPRTAARRIVWGKFTNAGQTCVAPDYLMASPAMLDRLVPELRRAIREMYGADPQRSPDYGRIVSARHHERLLAMIDDERAVIGGTGTADAASRYLPPTVLAGVGWDDPVMAEEIFGPILPLLAVSGPEEAIDRIVAGDKPLTAYVFTESREVERAFAARTSSGSLALGFTLAHVGSTAMPFGGVGASGTGKYHGRASLETFTHAKPVVRKPASPDTLALIRPPYRGLRKRLLRRLFR
ncbi:aldehyde dehydrogenase family protein [Brachybacterium sp. DNPG3]